VCGNIKRANFRVREGDQLLYIDIGNWIMPMDVSVLRDSAARLYSIGLLGASDEELLRRRADHSRPPIWDRLPGYSKLYGCILSNHLRPRIPIEGGARECPATPPRRSDVSLLIKACAMDSDTVEAQVRHLVQQFVGPSDFAERILAVDSYPGPYLRQHSAGDYEVLMAAARRLLDDKVVDRVLVSPSDSESARRINLDWFGLASNETHSREGIPVAPQLWAFDQISSRYVLQCDVDALVGRHDREHDYLGEMIAAAAPSDVVCVAFNVPQDPASPPQPYRAAPGEFKPEVRCGLLDLQRLRAARPLPNRVEEGRLVLPWYRSLHAYQRTTGMRTVRGGDPRAFYIHPLNSMKVDLGAIARVRDLAAQGLVPSSHWKRWDVGPDAADWQYPKRGEAVVIVARGRNTPLVKIDRFAAGLEMQSNQQFGVVVIDDGSTDSSPAYLRERCRWLGKRLTLIRHDRSHGHMLNNVIAVRQICSDPRSAIVFVDLDDALVDPMAIDRLAALFAEGHDVVLAAPFRPDAPTKVYEPDFRDPRGSFGGDVWIHLHSFAKRLFDELPDDCLKADGRWIERCDDYAIMIPIVELATSPIYVPEFWYWHERTTGWEPGERELRHAIISTLLAGSRLKRGATTAEHPAGSE
jgi:hypothetical protein